MAYLSNEIHRDGTSQIKRLAKALLPDYAKLNERSVNEYLHLLYNLAKHIIYYDSSNSPAGYWHDFLADFSDLNMVKAKLTELEKSADSKPHLALIISFLNLLEYANADLNKITGKHLEFFYNKVLRIARNSAKADKVHILFELAKNAKTAKLTKGALLDAGKDEDKNPKYYKLTNEIVVNQSEISSLRSVFVDKNNSYKLYSASVANSQDGKGKAFTEENATWKAFGETQVDYTESERTMSDAPVGFAIASPLLLLSSGNRTIKLTIACRTTLNQSKIFQNNFKVYITGEKDWIECKWISGSLKMSGKTDLIDSTAVYYNGDLEIEVKLDADAKSAIAFNSDLHSGGYKSSWPILKFILNPESTDYPYFLLSKIEVTSVKVTTEVSGFRNFILKNKQGIVDTSKPFLPFGPSPHVGSYFDISSSELSSKNIDSAKITVLWDNIPQSTLGTYYGSYFSGSPDINNDSFKTKISIYNNAQWTNLASGEQSLFDGINAADSHELNLSSAFKQNLSELLLSRTSSGNQIRIELSDLQSISGSEITELKAFGHQEYTNLYTEAAIKKALAETVTEFSSVTFPNEPYTPQLKDFSIYYESSDIINLDSITPTGQVFNIEPFGYHQIESESTNYNLLPNIENAGNFYIGIKSIVPPQNIRVLFQLAEGSGIISSVDKEESVSWSYLSKDGWSELSSLEIVTETTSNLQKSGIIEFTIGEDAVGGNSRFVDAGSLYWIKGTIESRPEQICELIQLYSNAAIAELNISKNKKPKIKSLPAKTISKLVKKNASIKKVNQPYSSFGGRQSESDTLYYTRVSERLRHKNRQIAPWDFEHAVLQEFPDVYKVKCLNHADAVSNSSPGSLTLLIISNLRNNVTANPLEPSISYGTLNSIKKIVEKYVSPFVSINVENPTYEQLLVDFKVGFHPGYDGGYYGNLLNEEIKKFLSPWAYDEGKDIVFGGKVYRSDILWFIENLSYVDYVTEFKLYHIYNSPSKTGIDYMQVENDFIVRDYTGKGIKEMEIGSTFIVGYESEIATAASPRSILVSAPKHRIEVINPGEYTCTGNIYGGIGKMAIEINFDVY